ncbi:zinc finger protein ZFAT [Nelusetta ayraudi]|uniref:zinc finger protein ZFAT n=1 Tax=Nelusetta ayraudi TaxID=303726 RepID=UPI003F7127EC
MDTHKAAGCMFMCRLCNLFSPSHTQLLTHCSQEHSQHGTPDDIIISLKPLPGEPAETLTSSPEKRKRGRPKGSKKKPCRNLAEGKADSTHSPEHALQKEDENKKNRKHFTLEEENHCGILGLECRLCHRSFSNRRQILKHICLGEEEVEDAEEKNGRNRGEPTVERSGTFGPAGTFTNKLKKNKTGPTCAIKKDGSPAAGNQKSVIGVAVIEDELLPGVFKMVPVEDNPAQADAAVIPSQEPLVDVESKEATDDPTACKINVDTGQEACSQSSTAKTAASRGFQEYSIKQDSPSLHKSQLKIFTCEFCNKIFKFKHSLVVHLRTHTQEKPFQCPHCQYASAIKGNLNVHLRKHTGEKFNCQHCPYSCLSPGHLKVHIERVHMKKKQRCSFCDKMYSDVKTLLKHMEKHHNLKDAAVQESYQQLRLKTRQGLRQLLYLCSTCNRRFKNKPDRDRHQLVHGPQRPFTCLLCDHAATRLEALASHVRKHLFLYVCSECEVKFASSQALTGHLAQCHGELEPKQAFAASVSSSFYLMQSGEDVLGEQHGGESAAERSSPESPAEQRVEGEPGMEELAGSRAASGEEESLRSQREGEEEGKQAMEEAKKTERSQDALQDGVSPGAGEADLVASDGRDSQSEVSGADHHGAFQQVLSTLQKTQLSMDSFLRFRKIYGDLECQYCGKLFLYKVHYNIHVRTHTKEHSHYCSKCSYSSITKSSLKRHQIQKHSGLLLSCSHQGCSYTTADKYKLQAHARIHREKGKNVACPICQNSYAEHRLKYHMKTSHPDTPPLQGTAVMVKRAEKCPYCDSYFLKNSSEYQRHIWAHQGLKPYACNLCDYAGRSRNNLKTHMNRHNTERRHLCDLCGKKFKSKVTLKSHRLSHTDEGKRFQCSECDFTAVSKPSLLRHMEQHTEFKPFRCGHCRYSCNSPGPLKRHYKMKHPDQKYHNTGPGLPNSAETLEQQGAMKCPQCEFVYSTKWELNRHLKNKHCLKVVEGTWEVSETVDPQCVPVEDEDMTEASVPAAQDNVNIQQITEFSSETYDAVTSMVAMAPGTVAVVQQVSDEQEVGHCGNQLMVVNQDGALTGNQVMVVEDAHGLEALTVLTQGENTHHYIVYVQEHTVEIN